MIHLHAHSRFSVGDALPTCEELAKSCEGGALAITDHDNLGGIVQHKKACKKHNVKPIYGVELTYEEEGEFHITLLAKNQQGLTNLFKLVEKENVSRSDICDRQEGLIALSGDLKGEIPQAILRQQRDRLQIAVSSFAHAFVDDFYFEIIDHGLEEQKQVNEFLTTLSKFDIPCVKTNDIHYASQEDALGHAVLMADKLGRHIEPKWALNHGVTEAYPKDLGDNPHAEEIVEKCDAELEFPEFPFLPDSGAENEDAYLWKRAKKALKRRFREDGIDDIETKKEYADRLKYEWEIICDMGYAGYYLIVEDFVRYAHKEDILVGPGRGSGAGSLVAYSLRITNVDPIKYNLIFERFLNPDRVSMPDFDIDFPKESRGEVIDYVREEYGHVTEIETYNEYKTKKSWQSAGRVMGVDPVVRDYCSDRYLEEGGLDDILKDKPEFEEEVDCARRIQGAYREKSVHAAGVLVADEPISNFVPVSPDQKCQLPFEDAEEMGMVKFDFLGLKELDVIEHTLRMIPKEMSADDIPMGDQEAIDLVADESVVGLFQISGDDIAAYVDTMNVESIHDIIAAIALYRPGPMDAGMHTEYVDRKKGISEVEYLHEDLEPILKDTYGIIVYQEQVMKIAQLIADYSLGEADILRRAMGKKKEKLMAEQKDIFFENAVDNGYEEDFVEELWSQIETFARYGFNRAHATSYGFITYQTAYLKAHWTAEFLAAQMRVRSNDLDKISRFVRDAERFGLDLFMPDVSKSPFQFDGYTDNVRYGIEPIKGLNTETAEKITNLRPFDDFEDFIKRVPMSTKDLEVLLYAGALDRLLDIETVEEKINRYPDIIAKKERLLDQAKEERENSQMAFDFIDYVYDVEETEREMRKWDLYKKEKDLLGVYRSGHPIEDYDVGRFDGIHLDAAEQFLGETEKVIGVVHDYEQRMRIDDETEEEHTYAIVEMEDETAHESLWWFDEPDFDLLEADEPILFDIYIGTYNDEISPIIQSAQTFAIEVV